MTTIRRTLRAALLLTAAAAATALAIPTYLAARLHPPKGR